MGTRLISTLNMKMRKHIFAVDTHTMGEPTRVVVGGTGPAPGSSMFEKKNYFRENLDYIRTALMHEPRGHGDMFGAIILDPVTSDASFGLLFMDGGGYLDMCGHGSIGAAAAALEIGLVEAIEPVTRLKIDTPAGTISACAELKNGAVETISIINVPSFLYEENVCVSCDNKNINVDIAFGGNYFAIVNARDAGLELTTANIGRFVNCGMGILQDINSRLSLKHPWTNRPMEVALVEFTGPPAGEHANARNLVVFGRGQFDRSPCGTGTCAKMAALYAKGLLELNQPFIHESIIGTTFTGRLIDRTTINGKTAVIPEITARSFITGIQQFIIDPRDPFKHGMGVLSGSSPHADINADP